MQKKLACNIELATEKNLYTARIRDPKFKYSIFLIGSCSFKGPLKLFQLFFCKLSFSTMFLEKKGFFSLNLAIMQVIKIGSIGIISANGHKRLMIFIICTTKKLFLVIDRYILWSWITSDLALSVNC